MDEWEINNNVIILHKQDGTIVVPSAIDILKSNEAGFFEVDNIKYESPSIALNFRISNVGVIPKYNLCRESSKCKITITVEKKGVTQIVGLYKGKYVDYIIIGNASIGLTFYYLGGRHDEVSTILSTYNNEKGLTLADCLNIIKQFKSAGIQLEDQISAEFEEEKKSIRIEARPGLCAKLYPYQQTGLSWLSYMVENGCGCILGDEMGLGKTLQIIALISDYKFHRPESHFLIGCPVSLLENWKREFNKFYPSISVHINHGIDRIAYYKDLLNYDVVLISYSSISSDLSMLNMINWDIVVLDEAQNIKNPNALRTKTAKELQRKVSIAVTGTPFENHLSDVWSLTDFVLPSYLGSLRDFETIYTDDVYSATQIEKLLSPILLRRRVADVAKDLPEKVVIPHPIKMTDEEALYYEHGRIEEDKNALNDKRLAYIQKLRMFCTHPFVYDTTLKKDNPFNYSYKYSLMCDLLEEIFNNKEKAVIFTSFNQMSEIIVNDCQKRFGVNTYYINGSVATENRQKIIDKFSEINGAALLVLNPKAAGAGLNITAANHVIHYNLEWNPSIEDQASARCYRRGQTKTVFIHRLFYVDTIEEFINEKIYNKRIISDAAVKGNDGDSTSYEIITEVWKYSPLK